MRGRLLDGRRNCQEFVRQFPDRVTGLILCATMCGGPRATYAEPSWRATFWTSSQTRSAAYKKIAASRMSPLSAIASAACCRSCTARYSTMADEEFDLFHHT